MRGLDFQKLEFPFARGLNQKADARLVQAPELVRGADVEFDEWGGLRLRYPFASIGTSIFGGGTISNTRRIVKCGNELLLFTHDKLYSWSSERTSWVSKGTHLAIKVDETPVFASPGDQVDADRAELAGTVMYAWVDNGAVYIAATDATTGAVLVPPTATTNTARPRLVALSTKILLFCLDATGNFVVYGVDPATPGTLGSATTLVAVASSGAVYDAERVPGTDTAVWAAKRAVTTSYEVGTVTAALSVAQATKARTCDGPIAVACNHDSGGAPSTAYVQIARGNSANIQGDLLAIATLADVNTGQALGSGSGTINAITATFVDEENAHVFWTSSKATDATDWDTDHNTVAIDNSVGTAARFIRRLALASRAFWYRDAASNTRAFVWLAFASESAFAGASPIEFRAQLQNTYFLYRHDGHWASMATWQRAGGFPATDGHLPGVQLTSGSTTFSWCAVERRIVPLGEKHLGYSDRGPRDVTFTFDSNAARRTAKLGGTLYVSGSPLLAYDGVQLVEAGWPIYSHYFAAVANLISGDLEDGVYTYKATRRWDNAKGERDRSTTATAGRITISSGPNGVEVVSWTPAYTTRKSGIVAEMWRTPVNAGADAPFYKVTSQDPAVTSNPNRYVADDPTAASNVQLNDELADSDLTTNESHPENDGVLENMSAPPASIIVASDTRLFLAGVAGDPHQVYYSKQRGENEVAAFHEALRVPIPEPGGSITGLAFLNETLVVFRETAIYALDGAGFDNTGGGSNFVARLVSSDCGAVSHEAIGLTPAGLVFKSSKGWYLLNRGWATDYIGAAVADYDSEPVYAVHVVENRHQVRCLTSGRMLVFDYSEDSSLKWSEWSVSDGLHACTWNGTYHYLATAAVKAEQTSYASADYGWDVEMLVHLGSLQGFSRVRNVLVLGEVRGSGSIRFRIGSYAEATYFDDKTWTISPTTAGSELNVRHMPSQQQHKALRVRLTSHTSSGEKPKLSALTLEVGFKPGVFRHLPAGQKQ